MYMVYKGIGLPTREAENQDPVHALALKFIQYMYDVDTEAEIWNLNSHNNQYPLNLLAQLFFNQMKWVDGV